MKDTSETCSSKFKANFGFEEISVHCIVGRRYKSCWCK